MNKSCHGPLTRYVNLRVAHAPGRPETFSPPPRISDPDMHHCTCATHVPWCMPVSLTNGFIWSRWKGKRSRRTPRMCDPHFYVYVSGKRPIMHSQNLSSSEISHNAWYAYAYILWKSTQSLSLISSKYSKYTCFQLVAFDNICMCLS